RQHLDRDKSIEPRVPGFVDLAHPPGAKRGQDLVRSEAEAGDKRHVCEGIIRWKEPSSHVHRRTSEVARVGYTSRTAPGHTERENGMRRFLWLVLLAVMTFIAAATPSRLASYQQPVADATDQTNRVTAQTGERSSSKIWTGRYQEFEEFLRTAEIERTTTVSTGVLGIKRAYFKPGGL